VPMKNRKGLNFIEATRRDCDVERVDFRSRWAAVLQHMSKPCRRLHNREVENNKLPNLESESMCDVNYYTCF
jgi:hypothetical protein